MPKDPNTPEMSVEVVNTLRLLEQEDERLQLEIAELDKKATTQEGIIQLIPDSHPVDTDKYISFYRQYVDLSRKIGITGLPAVTEKNFIFNQKKLLQNHEKVSSGIVTARKQLIEDMEKISKARTDLQRLATQKKLKTDRQNEIATLVVLYKQYDALLKIIASKDLTKIEPAHKAFAEACGAASGITPHAADLAEKVRTTKTAYLNELSKHRKNQYADYHTGIAKLAQEYQQLKNTSACNEFRAFCRGFLAKVQKYNEDMDQLLLYFTETVYQEEHGRIKADRRALLDAFTEMKKVGMTKIKAFIQGCDRHIQSCNNPTPEDERKKKGTLRHYIEELNGLYQYEVGLLEDFEVLEAADRFTKTQLDASRDAFRALGSTYEAIGARIALTEQIMTKIAAFKDLGYKPEFCTKLKDSIWEYRLHGKSNTIQLIEEQIGLESKSSNSLYTLLNKIKVTLLDAKRSPDPANTMESLEARMEAVKDTTPFFKAIFRIKNHLEVMEHYKSTDNTFKELARKLKEDLYRYAFVDCANSSDINKTSYEKFQQDFLTRLNSENVDEHKALWKWRVIALVTGGLSIIVEGVHSYRQTGHVAWHRTTRRALGDELQKLTNAVVLG